MTAALCSHNWNGGANAIDSTVKVDRKGLLPSLIGLLLEEPAETNSCVIEQDIKTALSKSSRLGNHILYIFLVGDITYQAEHLARILSLQPSRLPIDSLLVYIGQDYSLSSKGKHPLAESQSDS